MDIQAGLVVFIVIVLPLLDRGKVRALRLGLPGSTRMAIYQRGVATLWLAAAATIGATVLTGGQGPRLFLMNLPVAEAWRNQHPLLARSVMVAICAFFLVAVIQGLACIGNARRRGEIAPAFARLRFMLPVSRQERHWWILLSISAGICEEVVYRGFLLHFLLGEEPAGIGLEVLPALLLAALAFGLAHLYQGWRGMLTSTALGMAFGWLAIGTGSLLLPVALHALVDLQILWTYRPDLDGEPAIPVAESTENYPA